MEEVGLKGRAELGVGAVNGVSGVVGVAGPGMILGGDKGRDGVVDRPSIIFASSKMDR